MWFGQKLYEKDGRKNHGRWLPYERREDALADGCAFISVLERICSVGAYRRWQERHPNDRFEAHFRGPFYADFDAADDDLDRLRLALGDALRRLIKNHGLGAGDFQLWFSGGKGFHLLLEPYLFGAEGFGHKRLPLIYRAFAIKLGLGELFDHKVYSLGKGRMWRVAGIKRENGMAKVRIGLDQLRQLDATGLRARARAGVGRKPYPAKPRRIQSLCDLFGKCVVAVEQEQQKQARKQRQRVERADLPGFDGDWREVAHILEALPEGYADDYATWLTVGMALHDAARGGQVGRELWHAFSSRSSKYDVDEVDDRYAGFHEGRGITIASLFGMAKEAGIRRFE